VTLARLWLAFGAAYGFLGVALGAFGAHALKERLSPEFASIYHTAVEYQFWHALALLAVGVLATQRADPALNVAGAAFAAGVLVFSGSLYALSLTEVRALGAVTPLGGIALLLGWGALLWSVARG
jgi:uncharacterized membrane protein YgdD (TMEM256/DUF423 family)